MVIAALLCFAILFVAWLLAPGGRDVTSETVLQAEDTEAEALPVAA